MEEEVQTLLAAAVTGTVVWHRVPDDSALPVVVVNRFAGARDKTLDGVALMEGRIQIDCFGATAVEAMAASRQVRSALEGYVGGSILFVILDGIKDGLEGDPSEAHRVILRFSLQYRENL